MRNKFLYILSSLLVLFTACEYNEEHFPELGELTRPVDILNAEYLLTDADYAAISSDADNMALALERGDSTELADLKMTRMFSDRIKASDYVPALLSAKWTTKDVGSAVEIGFNEFNSVPVYLNQILNASIYDVSLDDYMTVWNGSPYSYFTPDKPLDKSANDILNGAFPEAENEEVVVLKYNFSELEPADYVDPIVTFVNEDFNTVVNNEPVELSGWVNFAEVGEVLWKGGTRDGNLFPQVTAFNTGGEAISWLISPEINLADATNPTLSFDLNLGYFNAYLMEVLISEDYNSGDPTTATWADVTHHFAIYGLQGGYTEFYVGGVMDLSEYQDNNIRVAFRYAGDANNSKTTTYRIDNVQIGDVNTVVAQTLSDFDDAFSTGMGSWTTQSVQGGNLWLEGSHNQLNYVGNTAFNSEEEQEGWLVSPVVSIPADGTSQLLVKLVERYHNADCLSVLVSENYVDDVTTANWDDVSDEFKRPVYSGNTSPISSYGAASLNDFKGKDVRIAFKYVGNADENRTTTYQIYDVDIVTYTRSEPETTPGLKSSSILQNNLYALYHKLDGVWRELDEAAILDAEDYNQMTGGSYFKKADDVDRLLSVYLNRVFPYASEDQSKVVVYLYGHSTSVAASEYVFTEGVWGRRLVIEQFVLKQNGWEWDPNRIINLAPVRNDPTIMAYYQAVADWVWENIDVPAGASKKGDGYVSSYGNNEYYAGTSAYYNNVDMRPEKAREQNPSVYGDLSDEQITSLMMERLAEVMGAVLGQLHAKATPIDGVDVSYTVNVGIFSGDQITDVTHSIVYKVVGPGEFELVSGPDPIAE